MSSKIKHALYPKKHFLNRGKTNTHTQELISNSVNTCLIFYLDEGINHTLLKSNSVKMLCTCSFIQSFSCLQKGPYFSLNWHVTYRSHSIILGFVFFLCMVHVSLTTWWQIKHPRLAAFEYKYPIFLPKTNTNIKKKKDKNVVKFIIGHKAGRCLSTTLIICTMHFLEKRIG